MTSRWVQGTALLLMLAWFLQARIRDGRSGWRATYLGQDWRRRQDWRRSLARGRLVNRLETELALRLSRGWLARPRKGWWLELPGLMVLVALTTLSPPVLRLVDDPVASGLLLAATCVAYWALGTWSEQRTRRRCEQLLAALRAPAAV